MNHSDEPLFKRSDISESPVATADPAVRERIRQLIDKQPYAVLCVQGGGQPYGALVAFAFSEDMRHAVFVTPVATRKYRLLSECDHVALVIDNRPDRKDELMEVEAVTITGRSQMIERGDEFEHLSGLLIARHAYLKSFVNAATCALFRIDVVRFLHVARFQEVNQWLPDDRC
jgi:nitroimidazol reductase NimA-like FMN-containing flavoprotein (pyridoxamine 5'-phosphate oxidase superfamily)